MQTSQLQPMPLMKVVKKSFLIFFSATFMARFAVRPTFMSQ